MKSILKTLSYSGSREIQRVQVVRWDSWDDLFFLHPVAQDIKNNHYDDQHYENDADYPPKIHVGFLTFF